jgi:hypothetical protein
MHANSLMGEGFPSSIFCSICYIAKQKIPLPFALKTHQTHTQAGPVKILPVL